MAQSDSISRTTLSTRKISSPFHDLEKVQWFEKNKCKLLKGAGVFSAIVICILLIVSYQRHQNSIALEKLRLGIAEFQMGRWEEAIPLLERARDLFGSGEKTQVANFYLIAAYSRQGQLDLTKNIVVSPSSLAEGDYLSQIVLLTKGKNAEKQNDQLAARKFYEEAVALEDGPLEAEVLLGLARVAEATGDAHAAVTIREKLLTTYPNSPFVDLIRKKLGK